MRTRVGSSGARTRARVAAVVTTALALFGSLTTDAFAATTGSASTPGAVTGFALAHTPVATTLIVNWSAPSSGPAPLGYVVWLSDETAFVGVAGCGSTCVSRSFAGLAPGHTYRAAIAPHNAVGWGVPSYSAAQAVTTGCASSYCVRIDSTTSTGAATQRAAGFLSATSRIWFGVSALRPQWWRVHSAQGNYQDLDLAASTGAKTILLMSDAWRVDAYDATRGGIVAPWEDWANYRQWVHRYVSSVLAAGRRPAFWEVMNEPGFEDYLNESGTNGATPDRVLEQFRVAYNEIKAVDPSAQVIGPSLERYAVDANTYPGLLDLRTFLDYVQAQKLRPAAVVWHEIEVNWAKNDATVLPGTIVDHVAEMRALLASRGMGDTKILIDEYGAPATYSMPGWNVGYLSALEAANVDGAMRSCWLATSGSVTYNQCDSGLNGLYARDNQTPLAAYYVNAAYASMTGTRIATTASTGRLSAYATKDKVGTVRALLGRTETCTPSITRDCRGRVPTVPAPVPVSLSIVLPANTPATAVTVTKVGPLASSSPAPVLTNAAMRVSGGVLSLSLPQVQDGEAYIVTVTTSSITAWSPTLARPR